MPPSAPKERFSDSFSPSFPLFRSALLAVLLTLGQSGDASAMPKIPEPAPFKNIEPEPQCRLTGTLELADDTLELEARCSQGKKIIIGDLVLTPDEEGHYKLPNSDVYFYISETGRPLISFIKDGKRKTGMLRKIDEGKYSFEPYLRFLTNKE